MESKIAFALIFISLYVLEIKAAIDEKLLMENIEECKKKNDLKDKDLEALKNHDFSEDKSKCFITCIGEKIGYIQDHAFSERGALSAIDLMMSDSTDKEKQKAQEVVANCANKFKDNPPKGCGIGPATAHCLAKGALDTGLMSKENLTMMQQNVKNS